METTQQRSPAGAFRYARLQPAKLASAVDHLWAFRGPTQDRYKRVMPTGGVELLLNFAEPYRSLAPGKRPLLLRDGWVGGPSAGPQIVEQPAFQDCLGVRLTPLGARQLLGCPLDALSGLSVRLEDLIGNGEARRLIEGCASLELRARLSFVARWLWERLSAQTLSPRVAGHVIARLHGSHGTTPIAALERETGLSKKRMLGLFRDHVGLTPKLYARVLRFRHVTRLLQAASPGASLASLALEAEFYDQPHMNAEFRALAGITPSEFLQSRHPVGDGSTVAARGELFSKT